MYGSGKAKALKRRSSFRENAVAIAFGILTFILLIEARKRGIQPKWVTAVLVTLIPFGILTYGYRAFLGRWAFWAGLIICLLVHGVGISLLFAYVLSDLTKVPILLWFPFMMVELFVLIVGVAKIHNSLTGKLEPLRFTF
jgi:hypothetical protein